MTLFWRRFREEARSLSTWALTVALTSVLAFSISLLIGNLKEAAQVLEKALSEMPAVLRSMIGGEASLSDPNYFAQSMLFGTIAPIVLMIFNATHVFGIYAKDAGLGNLEFLFSLPVKRFHLAASRVGVFLANLALLHVILFGASWIGSLIAGSIPDLSAFVLASAGSLLLNACLGGTIFLISFAILDYSRGILVAIGVQLTLFLLNMGLETRGAVLTAWNPYRYFPVEAILKGGSGPWGEFLVLALSAAALWLLGIRAYIRKQV